MIVVVFVQWEVSCTISLLGERIRGRLQMLCNVKVLARGAHVSSTMKCFRSVRTDDIKSARMRNDSHATLDSHLLFPSANGILFGSRTSGAEVPFGVSTIDARLRKASDSRVDWSAKGALD